MSRGSKTEESDSRPRVGGKERVHVRHEHDGHYTDRTDEHGDLAPGVDAVTTLHQEAGEPAADDGTEAGRGIDDDERIFNLAEIQTVVVVEKLGKIEKIEPPDRVGHTLGDAESVKTAVAKQDGIECPSLRDGGQINLGLGSTTAKPVVGKKKPDDKPDKPH